jgi:hypothetical protein
VFKKVHAYITFEIILVVNMLFTVSTNTPVIQQPEGFDSSPELIIGVNDAPDCFEKLKSIVTKYDGEIVQNISSRDRLFAVVAKIPLATTACSFFAEIQVAELARYVEPNVRDKVVYFEPNDPDWADPNHSWGPRQIKANWAWNTTIGDPSLLVAVVDSGIYYEHEDLAANYNASGYDWVNKDSDPLDDFGHGTHCAGIIAAEINNGEGIAGLAQVQIMAEKAIDDDGWAWFADSANAIIHATDAGARIISMSWGSYYRSSAIYDAVKYAYDHGALLVAAAGNDNWEGKPYPAAFDEVIAVTATNRYEYPAEYSNYGDWVELAAPGGEKYGNEGIYSTYPPNDYREACGTSMACPHVVGVAALIWSRFPDMSRDQVRVHLRKTADDLGVPGFDKYYGYGRVNANTSMCSPPNHDVLILDWDCPPYGKAEDYGNPTIINATVHNYGTIDEANVTVQLWVEGTYLVDSEVISSLASSETRTVNLSWTPWWERDWNISCRVVPVPGEEDTRDNTVWTILPTEVGIIKVSKQSYRFKTIQGAVDAAYPCDRIQVANGTYEETVNIYKDGLKLIGEDRKGTIIDCKNKDGTWGIILSRVQGIQISGFTVKRVYSYGIRPDLSTAHSGILLYSTHDCLITDNIIEQCVSDGAVVSGIQVSLWCTNNTITNNKIWHNSAELRGITLYHTIGSPSNVIMGNFITNVGYGIVLESASCNIIYHNNIMDIFGGGSHLVNDTACSNCWVGQWGTEGNYWSNYNGTDWNQTKCSIGIGDDYWPWLKVDPRPLMEPWLPGDADHDGAVGPIDLAMLGAAWGSSRPPPPDPNWDPHVDFNEDGIIDPIDLGILGANWGKFWQDYWEI